MMGGGVLSCFDFLPCCFVNVLESSGLLWGNDGMSGSAYSIGEDRKIEGEKVVGDLVAEMLRPPILLRPVPNTRDAASRQVFVVPGIRRIEQL